MTQTSSSDAFRCERFSLRVSIAANLFMALAGVTTAALSNSEAILMDGLFSMIGFLSAFVALRISRNIEAGPNRIRPLGYGADESLFTTFRALSLLGLVAFALGNAAVNIGRYLGGHTPQQLNYEPVGFYLAMIGLMCFGLWAFHHWNWRKTGKASDILRLESKAAVFDGLVTAAAGAGLFGIQLLADTPFAPIVPVGDSLLVLALCSMAAVQYYQDFQTGLGELAGVTAAPKNVAIARRAVRDVVHNWGASLVDLAVFKNGRTFSIILTVDPVKAVTSNEVDIFKNDANIPLQNALGQTDLFVVIASRK